MYVCASRLNAAETDHHNGRFVLLLSLALPGQGRDGWGTTENSEDHWEQQQGAEAFITENIHLPPPNSTITVTDISEIHSILAPPRAWSILPKSIQKEKERKKKKRNQT